MTSHDHSPIIGVLVVLCSGYFMAHETISRPVRIVCLDLVSEFGWRLLVTSKQCEWKTDVARFTAIGVLRHIDGEGVGRKPIVPLPVASETYPVA